jgi:hypothetical protein
MLRLESFAGGLNDTDPPHRIGDDQLSAVTDFELTPSGGLVRRSGVARASAQPASGLDYPLLHRHTPTNALSATELWALPVSSANFYRSTTGTTWAAIANNDASLSSGLSITDAASFNGKLFFAYETTSGADRLRVWDGNSIRLVGISTPAAPTATNTGVGSYAATVRYYRVQFAYTNGDAKYVFSDLSDALTFTPSGSGTGVVVTKPTTLDGASSWRLWASADDVTYYAIDSELVGTTTITDSTAPASYVSEIPSLVEPEAGAFTPPWSAKYLLVDENRLLIAGAFENTRYASRIGWSSIIGTARTAYGESSIINDDERFPPEHYLDLDSDEGGPLTGMEMLSGSVYVFKRYATYKLVRTGDTSAPYKPVTISKVIGAISRKSIIPGEDEHGSPCLYFLSERGPYRLGQAGLQYLGGDIETVWGLVNPRPSTVGAHGVYDARKGQVRWWVPRGAVTYPTQQLVFHVRLGRAREHGHVRGGWATTANTATGGVVLASVMWPTDLTTRDSALAPYAIHKNGDMSYPPVIWSYTTGAASDDTVHTTTGAITGTTTFAPTVTTKTFSLGLGDNSGVRDVYVACTPAAGGVALTATLSRNFSASTASASRTFTGTTARQPQQITDLVMANAQYISATLTSATQAAFTIDELALRVSREEPE